MIDLKVNAVQIVSMKLVPNRVHPYYKWKYEFSLFGITFIKSGFYYTFTLDGDHYKSTGEILSNDTLTIEGRKVFFRPHIIFELYNGSNVYKYFDNVDDARDYWDSFNFEFGTEVFKSSDN
jgi:hypothetical protein